jgi:hypothetical protein
LFGGVQIRVGKQHNKFFTAIASYHISPADVPLKSATRFAQHGIACPVSPGIVDVFEMIQVDEHDCARFLCPLASREFLIYLIHHGSVIGQASERVGQGDLLHSQQFRLCRANASAARSDTIWRQVELCG